MAFGHQPRREAAPGCRPEGSAIAIMAPVVVPQEVARLPGKSRGARGPRPLGAAMRSPLLKLAGQKYNGPSSSAVRTNRRHTTGPAITADGTRSLLTCSDANAVSTMHALWGPGMVSSACHTAGTSTATTGAWPSPTIRGWLAGVQDGDDGPFPRSLEHGCYAGESPWGRDSRPLGAGMDSSAFEALPHATSTCQNGHGLRPLITASACLGSTTAIMAPSGGPLKQPICRGKSRRVRGPALWGQQWTRLPKAGRRSD